MFDEATSNIDADSEAVIMNNVRALARRATVIVVSHRLENVVGADNIYYLKNGCVTEKGSHDALCAENGEYAALYRTQKDLECGYKAYVKGGAL